MYYRQLIIFLIIFISTSSIKLIGAELSPPTQFNFTKKSKSLDLTTSIINQHVKTIDDDLIGIINIPKNYPTLTRNSLILVGGLILTDRYVTGLYQDKVETPLSGFKLPYLPYSDRFTDVGFSAEDVWLFSGLAINYGYGIITKRERPQRASIKSLKAIAYSNIVSQIFLKSLIARKRPFQDLNNGENTNDSLTDNPLEFGHYHGISIKPDAYGTAMPSYHFTQFFSVAHVLSGTYENSWWPYGGAALLSLSNIRGHNHWVSDMVAGSLLGIGIGEVILRNSEDYKIGDYTLKTDLTIDGIAINLIKEF